MSNFFDKTWIDEVRSRNDIVEVIGEYLRLKPSGRNFVALCPFHSEKTPSFSVSPDKQIYHCFGCGEGGNVISFIMAMEKLDFVEAVKLLARRAGMPIPESDGYVNPKDIIYRINTDAARYFHNCLKSQEGKPAREYLARRGISTGTITKFGLGFAPNKWDGLKQHLLTLGYKPKELLDSGLIISSKNGENIYDRFRGRLMFPIFDIKKHVIGFGGRVLDGSLPKYLNSPETLVFHKGSGLYALNFAAKAKDIEAIIVVEGYMDAIMLHQHGLDNVVASLGTSLTGEQAKLIRRYTPRAVICYDGDAAGKRAAGRGLDILLNEGLDVYVLALPDGLDPDEFIRKNGRDAFIEMVRSAKPWLEYSMDVLASRLDMTATNGKTAFAREAVKLLKGVEDPMQKDLYLKDIARYSGISLDVLYRYANRTKQPPDRPVQQPAFEKIQAVRKAEHEILNVMLNQPEVADFIMKHLDVSDFEYDIDKELFEIISKCYKSGDKLELADIISNYLGKNNEKEVLAIFTNDIKYDNIYKFVRQCISVIKINKIETKRRILCKKAEELASSDNKEHLNILLRQIGQLDKELLELKEK